MNIAIILAGGTGTRVGAGIPKQFIQVQNKPILAYTLEIFQENPLIDAIEIVCHKDWLDDVEEICIQYGTTRKRWICTGGATFQESAFPIREEWQGDTGRLYMSDDSSSGCVDKLH